MTDLDRLSNLLPAEQNPVRVHRMWRAIENAHHHQTLLKRRRRPALILLGAGAVAAAVMLVLFLLPRSTPGPLTTEQGAPIPREFPATQTTHRQFSDGSALKVETGTQVSLVENSAREVVFSLTKGRVQFDIVPGGPQVWQVNCENVIVTVLGTAFTVEKDRTHVSVAVNRGVVLVSGEALPNGERLLTAGESMRITDEEDTPVEAEAKHHIKPPVPISPPPNDADKKRQLSHSSWLVHAEAGDYDEAFKQLGSSGVASLAKQSIDVDELFKLSDVARLTGHPRDAVVPLKSILEKFEANPQAGLAAYTLGRLYLEHLSSPRKAVAAFDKALALGIPDALEEAVMVKKIKAFLLQGDAQGKSLASEYLTKYPKGRYRAQVQSLLTAKTRHHP